VTDQTADTPPAADPNPMAWVDDSPLDVRLFLVGIVLALIVVGFIIGVPVGMLLQDMRAGG
jgi:hypothetical protein